MFIRTLEDVRGTDRYKVLLNGALHSARYLSAADGMGFSLHVNRSKPCPPMPLWYKNHWEANYIISGVINVTDLTTQQTWKLGPDDLYQVGPNDRHYFEVVEEEHHLSIFCPALTGDETHDADGSYSPSGPVPETDQCMFLRRIDEMRAAGKEIVTANGQARVVRALTKSDGLGVGVSDVNLTAGASTVLWYKHHWETNYILSGTGLVEDLNTGESWKLEADIAYNVGPKDRHRLSAHTDLHLVSVFCPPLVGNEQHDADGALEPSGPVPPGPPGY
jgi:L-ectoine synthase